MIHVGISGPIASGKSYLAEQLKQAVMRQGYAAEIHSFAEGIRELIAFEHLPYRQVSITRKLFDWGFDTVQAIQAAKMIEQYMVEYPSQPGVKNRRLMQLIGTEVGRWFLGTDTWIHRTKQLFLANKLDFGFSDDLRFDNEALSVDVHIAITITGVEQQILYMSRVNSFAGDYTFSNHASETSLTYPPLLTIPIGFTTVTELADTLSYIRRLRG